MRTFGLSVRTFHAHGRCKHRPWAQLSGNRSPGFHRGVRDCDEGEGTFSGFALDGDPMTFDLLAVDLEDSDALARIPGGDVITLVHPTDLAVVFETQQAETICCFHKLPASASVLAIGKLLLDYYGSSGGRACIGGTGEGLRLTLAVRQTVRTDHRGWRRG